MAPVEALANAIAVRGRGGPRLRPFHQLRIARPRSFARVIAGVKCAASCLTSQNSALMRWNARHSLDRHKAIRCRVRVKANMSVEAPLPRSSLPPPPAPRLPFTSPFVLLESQSPASAAQTRRP